MMAQYQVTGSSAAAISASVETGVRTGGLAAGAALPPIRALAEALQVSPATVARAYQDLRQRGVLEAAGRHGTRVRARPAVAGARSAQVLPVPAGAVDLASGQPDLRLLPSLGPHLQALADQMSAPLGYLDSAVPELIDAARDRLAADAVPMADADLTVTAGALDAVERLLTTHLRPGDAVGVEDPGWANMLDLVAALGLRPVPMPVDDDGPSPAGVAAALSAGVRALIVTTRAHNPTGAAVGAERAAELRRVLLARPDVLLIEDDHAAELAGVPLHCLAGSTTAWAFVRSASKPYGPDLRIAILAGDPATVARVVGRLRTGAGWVSSVLQRLLLSLWRDPSVGAGVAAAAGDYRRRRVGLRDALIARGVPARGVTGINVWVPVTDETRTVGLLRDAGIVVAAGSLYRIASGPAIRITVSPLGTGERELTAVADAVADAVRPGRSAGSSR
ncbi:MAG TPA: aminotransferase class I/II-fold pyridoxal phosphate-dependent enzyme [Actinoplanes sp.]|nr:aminotransferase class I/II-fold pyridoxal phosphate-dependent enzyme [Actinoplanes sp.]